MLDRELPIHVKNILSAIRKIENVRFQLKEYVDGKEYKCEVCGQRVYEDGTYILPATAVERDTALVEIEAKLYRLLSKIVA